MANAEDVQELVSGNGGPLPALRKLADMNATILFDLSGENGG